MYGPKDRTLFWLSKLRVITVPQWLLKLKKAECFLTRLFFIDRKQDTTLSLYKYPTLICLLFFFHYVGAGSLKHLNKHPKHIKYFTFLSHCLFSLGNAILISQCEPGLSMVVVKEKAPSPMFPACCPYRTVESMSYLEVWSYLCW